MLPRLALFCYRRRRIVVVAWILILVGLSVLSKTAGGQYRTDFRLPDTESRRAFAVLARAFPQQSGMSGQLVVAAPSTGVRDAAVHARVDALLTRISTIDGVARVVSPYSAQSRGQTSPDGKIAFATMQFRDMDFEHFQPVGKAITAAVQGARASDASAGVQYELGGEMFSDFRPPSSEALGLIAAVVILLIAFGSVLAMGLPLMTALFGIGCGMALVVLLTRVLSVPNFTAQVAAMIGIGVGIDYALFIVTRYRSALHSGKDPEAAVVESLSTAGRAVLFAGCTVVISLLGMFFMRLSFIAGLAVGASSAVVMTMLASLTLLPATLGFVGHNIDRLGLPHRTRRDTSVEHQFWYRWSRAIQHRPVPFAVGGFLVLLTLSIPVFSLQLGSSDPGNNPARDTTRRAYDLLSQGFGPGFNGPLVLAATTSSAGDQSAVQALAGSLSKMDGIAFASPAIPNASGDAAIIQVIPKTSPQDHKTVVLIDHLRKSVVPAALAGTGARVYIGGQTAVYADLSQVMASRLPYFLGAVLILSFLLLMVVFRSLLVPLKAVVMNLLSIGAAYGTLVAIFQWGWAKDLFGIGRAGPIESWAPMMLFAIVFGLSMDYEVFLLSRMREEYDRTHDNAVAVADGLASTARVITAAAAIMVAVFGSFVLQDLRPIKLVGLGLSVAVLIDATVVRLVLVPATMELIGDRNWWFPAWLDRLIPRFNVEGAPSDLAPSVEDVGGIDRPDEVPVLTPGG